MSLPELSGSLTRKRKGEISFETPPSACPILEDPIRPPDHSIVMPELIGIARVNPLPVPFRHHIRCKSFLRLSVRIQFPESLPGSRCRFPRQPLSALFSWKIARSCCFPSPLARTRPGFTRAASGEFPREAPLFGSSRDLGSVLPRPHLRKFRKVFRFRSRSWQPGLTRAAVNPAAKRFHCPSRLNPFGFTLARPVTSNRGAFPLNPTHSG